MIEELLPAALGGAGLAGLYLALLWTSVRRIASGAPSAPRVLGGAALRIAAVCGGLYLLSGGDGLRLTAALLGFVAVRSVALVAARRPAGSRP